ncbi:MAG: glycosyltransferase family 87 protein, partial [Acidobacteriaceae bacterium]
TFNEIYPLHDGAYGPSPYPPFVALFFSLFARVPFLPAFFLWAGTSLALYITGIAAIVKDIFPGERLKVSLIFCFALAFSPFLYSTLANGQIGALAVCSVGFAFALERRSKPFASGMALSILAYKPTLLLLLIPMLLLTRRFRAFSGFTIGAAMLILTATACGGMQIWPAYAHFLSYFGRVAGFDGHSVLRLWKYVDFSSFLQAVCGGRSSVELGILIAATSGIAAGLAVLLWKSARCGMPAQSMAWAATLTWTLLLNVYVPVYDSILVTISVVLTLRAMKGMEWKTAMRWTIFMSVFLCLASWWTDAIALRHGIQVLTILLAVLGLVQLYLLRRAIGWGVPQTVTGVPSG